MNELTAKDLMVGDWFNFLIDIEGGHTEYDPKNEVYQPMQVRDITSFGVNDGEVSSYEGVVNDIAQLQPIPLTVEILEKNGFIIKKKWAQIGNFGNSPLIMWHFADDPILRNYNTELEIHQNDTGKVHVRIPCKYVHELQRALRLCHINKEITL